MRGRPITFRYKHFIYDPKINNLIASTVFTDKDNLKLEKIINNYNYLKINRGYKYIIKDLYILVKNKLSTKEISEIYGVSTRTIQKWLKELGMSRSKKEAQKIAVKKRDYTSIHNSYKETMLNKLLIENPTIIHREDSIRFQLMNILRNLFKNCEIIVGINGLGVGGSIKDIPIVIIKNNITYKFIITSHPTITLRDYVVLAMTEDINSIVNKILSKLNL
ncbi:helix-turn-helix domain-containing protein [Clostridium botulinum]|uniref:helix-turn-helix domain-containing protein n=1 Tax=Clostridium botulinum TaxID=1491 RepID=UPI0004D7F3E5|nr:helix-turn-helix domain-containing protein [Clostridium botulinum]MCD3352156.1 helix-turn-helix domain-containing protein [Clostridium botulinum D/C]KEH99956.1 site specific tyrosine recombinase XerC [Clostridium botulinum C/D str. BKT75002]KEI05678.1 site specific tyrosine recombinase XerC [Clostridium botulinum C/D str. BKT2873]KOC49903.1 recombinase XerC [Clostridium botulinum]MCD3361104.1 helix-turn-helix domain-containing protein [Clostridium botulinum D/C]